MSIQLAVPPKRELKPRIIVLGVGGAGGNAVNNMVAAGLEGVEFVVTNTDAQALSDSQAERRIQIGSKLTEGLGAGSDPEIGRQAAEETMAEIVDVLQGAHMVFVTAGMGGGTGTGATPVIARAARELGILTVGVVTKPFEFEGRRRAGSAETGIEELAKEVDTLIIIPNQNLFRIANAQTTFAEAFAMADEVLHSGVAGITDLMVKPGLINLDFADVRTVMNEMGKAMMGTGEAQGENRAIESAEMAIANPLLDDVSMQGAQGVLISISGGQDMTLYEVDEAANRIKQEVDEDANIIIGSTFDDKLDGSIRVSVVATGIGLAAEAPARQPTRPTHLREVTAEEMAEAEAPTEIIIPEFEGDDLPPAEELPPVPNGATGTGGFSVAEFSGETPPKNASDLPGFLQPKPMRPPEREIPKRSRSFLERVFGKKKPEEAQGIVSLTAESQPPKKRKVQAKPEREEDKVMEMLDELEADTIVPVKTVAPERVAEAAPKVAVLEPVAEAAPEPVEQPTVTAETPSAVQTTMQTTPDTAAPLDSDRLDIPAFLRR